MKRKLEMDDIVTIDAGGTLFKTWRSTMVNSINYFPGNMLADIFAEECPATSVGEGGVSTYFIDTDGKIFRHILQMLRRCAPLTEPPRGIPLAVWHKELDYWCLTERSVSQEILSADAQKREYTRNLVSLERLGEEIRTKIKDNEVTAVRAILDGSGYSAQSDKTRSRKIRLPIGGHKLACGTDLGTYVKENAPFLKPMLTKILGPSAVVTIGKDHTTKNFLQYEFAEKSYNTKETDTVVVDISFTQL